MSNTVQLEFRATDIPGIFASQAGFHVGTLDGRHIGHIPRESLDDALRIQLERELARLIFEFKTESLGLDQAHELVHQLAERIGGPA